MADTFIKVIDEAVRSLVFTKFGDDMGFSSIESDDVILFPKEVAQRVIAEKRGVNEVEFANVWREATNIDWSRQRTPLARHGVWGSYVDGESPASGISGERIALVNAKAVPGTFDYGIWFWSQDKDKVNAVTETYMFWPQDDPNLSLILNDIYPLEFDLHFGEILDESDLPTIFEVGRLFVIHIPLKVDGWVFNLSQTRTIKKIVLTLWDHDNILDRYDDEEEFLQDAPSSEKSVLQLYQETPSADE